MEIKSAKKTIEELTHKQRLQLDFTSRTCCCYCRPWSTLSLSLSLSLLACFRGREFVLDCLLLLSWVLSSSLFLVSSVARLSFVVGSSRVFLSRRREFSILSGWSSWVLESRAVCRHCSVSSTDQATDLPITAPHFLRPSFSQTFNPRSTNRV